MSDLKLSFAMTPYDRMLPIINGEVKPDGISLENAGMPGSVPRVFYEQMKFQRYDVSEMSMSSYLRMRAIGWPYLILPVYHNRNFSYCYVQIRKGSGIRQGHPEDLKSKRIGIGDYQQSLGLWTRGIFQMEFGVKPEDMEWYQERGQHFSHTGASLEAGLKMPDMVSLHFAKTDFMTMFNQGELDASCGLGPGTGIAPSSNLDRGTHDYSINPDVVPLFPDPRQEAVRFFKKTGVYPPHHVTVVRESIIKEHPWAAVSLMQAFEKSKQIATERLRQNPPGLLVFGAHFIRDMDAIFGADPFKYGIPANAKAFDMAQEFSVQQGLTPEKQPWDEIFPREVIYSEEIQ
jgi:4,5-dihydroxyphthalate decarboxylase